VNRQDDIYHAKRTVYTSGYVNQHILAKHYASSNSASIAVYAGNQVLFVFPHGYVISNCVDSTSEVFFQKVSSTEKKIKREHSRIGQNVCKAGDV